MMKLILMISIIAVLAILSIDSVEAGSFIFTSTIDYCPKVGPIAAEYEVRGVHHQNPDEPENGGCAFINFKSNNTIEKEFIVWYGPLHDNGTVRCGDKKKMLHMRFLCYRKPSKKDSANTTMYEELMGQSVNIFPPRYCAMHNMLEGKGDGTTFRMAINLEPSCRLLPNWLGHNIEEDKDYEWSVENSGIVLLQFNRTRLVLDQSLDDMSDF